MMQKAHSSGMLWVRLVSSWQTVVQEAKQVIMDLKTMMMVSEMFVQNEMIIDT